jgi:membrane dipeptidase
MSKIYDLHADILSHFHYINEYKKESDVFKKYHLDNFKKGKVALSVFTLWNDRTGKEAKKRLYQMLESAAKELYLAKDFVNVIHNRSEIKEDKINALLGLEGLDGLDSADEFYTFYQFGFRVATIMWNNSNVFATSSKEDADNGLSNEGKRLVKILNELGVIIDISHCSDQSSLDILSLSNAPIIASHSNAFTITKSIRNLNDEILRKIKANGGLVGLNALPFVLNDNIDKASIQDIIKHIDYLKDIIGIDHIALGFDYCGYLDEAEELSGNYTGLIELYDQKDNQKLIVALQEAGYDDTDIAKIAYKNFERIMDQVLK